MSARRAVFIGMLVGMGLAVATTAHARDSLGVFEGWGAFRDPDVPRCYAIARSSAKGTDGRSQPFASVGYWPRSNVRGQIHIRLSREIPARSPLTLSIGERRFPMIGGGTDAWAPNRQGDAAIIAAMRSATSMSVSARARTGAGFADSYRLRGAASAIDAAALGCGRLR
ncbi:hypothetical protein [Sphingobium sp.]|uniref:hypothetical protein n=1 Tax=Sphingobium sp. TaxID=1912891 RepID=UPI0039C90CD7